MTARRILTLGVIAFLLVFRPVLVPPAAACSCAMDPDPVGAAAQADTTFVFTGIVQPPTDVGTPVVLTRWFEGSPPGSIVALDNQGFQDPTGASCGVARPPAGTEWIFVSGLAEGGLFGVSLCTTHADLATPEGQDLLAAANSRFGDGSLPSADPDPPPEPAPAPASGGPSMDTVMLVVAGAVAAVGIAVAAGAVLWRRRPTPAGD
jgi:hypothetical protein